MTDIEKLLKIFNEFGIKTECYANNEYHELEIIVTDNESKDSKVTGDGWAECIFCFDRNGTFKKVVLDCN